MNNANRARIYHTESEEMEGNKTPYSTRNIKSSPNGLLFEFRGSLGAQKGRRIKGYSPMKQYTNPKINRVDPKKWYIEFYCVVPAELKHLFKRNTARFRKYGDINSYKGAERETNAEELRAQWLFLLKNGYNPFDEVIEEHQIMNETIEKVESLEETVKAEENKQLSLTDEDLRKQTKIRDAFDVYIKDLKTRIINNNSISTYKGTTKWMYAYFESRNRLDDYISSVRHIEISSALKEAQALKKWNNTTFNKEKNIAMTILNWFATEEYTIKNVSKGRIAKLKTKKTKHTWYDRDLAKRVKQELISKKCWPVYRACQFTYLLFIRSKSELMQLKISDIDTTLKRIRFSADLSKNSEEAYRDYSPEFEKVIQEMELYKYPSHFYVFGKQGEPSEFKCHKDFLANQWREVRDEMGLSDRYTIYSWKHTGIIHDLMKGKDGSEIGHKARHSDFKTTKDYLRDYDFTLKNIYKPEDLTF